MDKDRNRSRWERKQRYHEKDKEKWVARREYKRVMEELKMEEASEENFYNEVEAQEELTEEQVAEQESVVKTEVSNAIAQNKVVVLIDEEYGYRYFFWITDFATVTELEDWWKNLESVSDHYLDFPALLKQHGTVHDGCVSGGSDNYWVNLHKGGLLPYIHLHWDDDSWLHTQTGTHNHKGWKPFNPNNP